MIFRHQQCLPSVLTAFQTLSSVVDAFWEFKCGLSVITRLRFCFDRKRALLKNSISAISNSSGTVVSKATICREGLQAKQIKFKARSQSSLPNFFQL